MIARALDLTEQALSSPFAAIIGSELKKLYVALTRGRNQVHFWDNSDQVEPVKVSLLSIALRYKGERSS